MTRTFPLAPVVLIVLLAGCSTFHRDYDAAVANGVKADSVEGPYEGRWESQNGHGGGRLLALLTRTSSDVIHARFRSSFLWVLEGEDEVDFRVTGTSPVRAAGEADLGFLKGGIYHYDATITPAALDATYEAKHDHGTFKLARPK